MTTQYNFKILAPETKEQTQHVIVSPAPDWDDFKAFSEQFIEHQGATVISTDYGMDRHQVDYELEGKRFRLNYEHYTQSVWIEPA